MSRARGAIVVGLALILATGAMAAALPPAHNDGVLTIGLALEPPNLDPTATSAPLTTAASNAGIISGG